MSSRLRSTRRGADRFMLAGRVSRLPAPAHSARRPDRRSLVSSSNAARMRRSSRGSAGAQHPLAMEACRRRDDIQAAPTTRSTNAPRATYAIRASDRECRVASELPPSLGATADRAVPPTCWHLVILQTKDSEGPAARLRDRPPSNACPRATRVGPRSWMRVQDRDMTEVLIRGTGSRRHAPGNGQYGCTATLQLDMEAAA